MRDATGEESLKNILNFNKEVRKPKGFQREKILAVLEPHSKRKHNLWSKKAKKRREEKRREERREEKRREEKRREEKRREEKIKRSKEGKCINTNSQGTVYGKTKRGYLSKQGGSSKGWKRRWCVFENNALFYYKQEGVCFPFPFPFPSFSSSCAPSFLASLWLLIS